MTNKDPSERENLFEAVHHVGVSVTNLDRSVAFWERFLGATHPETRIVEAPFIGDLVGYPGVTLHIAWVDIPGGDRLELVEYRGRPEPQLPAGSAHPGTVHICIGVHDLDVALEAAIEAGATRASAAVVEIPSGPNKGARHVYVNDPDGATIELRQAPPTPT
jgi:catechol 2,3-dioxygenase-like lactoylglutathione lyase family enzyme